MPELQPIARVYFHTLGCPKNDADSRYLMRELGNTGIEVVDDPSVATHLVVNTCGFIHDAKEESIDAILGLCSEYPGKEVVVVGCLVERYREELAAGIPEVRTWLGVINDEVSRRLAGVMVGESMVGGASSLRGPLPKAMTGSKSYAYLKISDGCDERCTFCAIPGFKGGYGSVPVEEILREADACLNDGVAELVLVGQDTTRYASGGLDLQGLVELLASDERVRRIRVMYLQPARLGDKFLGFMAGSDKLCRYLDVPFQHSHREVLRRMGRRGEMASYVDLLERARNLMPSVTTRSTFIVGFPGETKEHFEHLLDFVKTVRFDYGGAFIYSPEEGTVAAGLRPAVRGATAQKRFNLLTEALLEGGIARREALLGEEVQVLVDSVGGDDVVEGVVAVGRTEGQAPEVDGVTYVTGPDAAGIGVGQMVKVKVTEVVGCDLVGEIVAS